MYQKKLVIISIILSVFATPFLGHAQQVINVKAAPFVYNTKLFLSPTTETVIEGSTFDVSVLLDTNKLSINTIDLNLKFSPDTLSIVDPSAGGRSLITVWLQPPTYSNAGGTANYAGIVPNGITTGQGVVVTVTFKAIKSGRASVSVAPTSRVLLNDGLGTETTVGFGKGFYAIEPQPPAGVTVFSETHPFSDKWYNNNNVTLSWEKDPGVTDFSFDLDTEPFTIPDNTPDGTETAKSYENLHDGLWYFHIKAEKAGVWGGTTHFPIRIDTTPPAGFSPVIELLKSGKDTKILASFFTTDELSGVDHYEVGVVDINKSSLQTPVFVQTDSPYQLPVIGEDAVRVYVRAMDAAGNVMDETSDVYGPANWVTWAKNNSLTVILILLLLLILLIVFHFLYGHRIISHTRAAFRLFKKIEKEEHEALTSIHHEEEKTP